MTNRCRVCRENPIHEDYGIPLCAECGRVAMKANLTREVLKKFEDDYKRSLKRMKRHDSSEERREGK